MARGVCRPWREAVEHPSAQDARRMICILIDPRAESRAGWIVGRLFCMSALVDMLSETPSPITPDPGSAPDDASLARRNEGRLDDANEVDTGEPADREPKKRRTPPDRRPDLRRRSKRQRATRSTGAGLYDNDDDDDDGHDDHKHGGSAGRSNHGKKGYGPERRRREIDALVAWARWYAPRGATGDRIATALAVSGDPVAVGMAFSRRCTDEAAAALRAWMRDRRMRRDSDSARAPGLPMPPPDPDAPAGPDAWWVADPAGGPAARPWEDVRYAVGGCAAAALAAVVLRACARRGIVAGVEMLVSIGDAPAGLYEAVFDAAAGGHVEFVARTAALVAASDRYRAAGVVHHAWMGAAAGGRTDVMRALMGAEAGLGHMGRAATTGRRMATGPPHAYGAAARIALACDRPAYFAVTGPAGLGPGAFRSDLAPRLALADALLPGAVAAGSFAVARWLVDGALGSEEDDDGNADGSALPDRGTGSARGMRDFVSPSVAATDDTGVLRRMDAVARRSIRAGVVVTSSGWASLGRECIVAAVVDGWGPRDDAPRALAWARDALDAHPDEECAATIVRCALRFERASHMAGAMERRLHSGVRYMRLLEAMVAAVETWPRASALGDGIALRDAGLPYRSCLVDLLVARACGVRLVGDLCGRRHARRRALRCLARLALVAHPSDTPPQGDKDADDGPQRRSRDPWTSVQAHVENAIGERDRSPALAIDALVGAATVVALCAIAIRGEDASDERQPLVASCIARVRRKDIIDGKDARGAKAWRRWCGLAPTVEDERDGAMRRRIDEWTRRVHAHPAFGP
jgi:hypothetical protein